VLLLHHAGDEIGGAPRTRTLDTQKVRLFSRQFPRSTGRAPFVASGSSPWHRTKLTPLNRRAAHSVRWEDFKRRAPGRILACIFPLRGRAPDMFGHESYLKNGRAPRCCPECLLVPSEADCCLPRARLIKCRHENWHPVRALLPRRGRKGIDAVGGWASRPSARRAAALRS
jgi:hypothetical protein